MAEEYAVRYRITSTSGHPALIVTDCHGNAYLYASGALQFRATNDETGEGILGRLGSRWRWESLPPGEVYTLDALGRLAAGAAATPAACE